MNTKPECLFILHDVVGIEYDCNLPCGHSGPHICYCDDGESCDRSQPEPKEDGDYIVETVNWSVCWPNSQEQHTSALLDGREWREFPGVSSE